MRISPLSGSVLDASQQTRLTVVEEKMCFIDMYFASCIAKSESWERRMQLMVHEALQNKGSVSKSLYLKYYPIRNDTNTIPTVDWEKLGEKPYLDD